MFTDLLNRMQSMLQREDISVVLNSVQETKSPVKDELEYSSPLPKIDFNVNEADLERHRQLMATVDEAEQEADAEDLGDELMNDQSSDKKEEEDNEDEKEEENKASET